VNKLRNSILYCIFILFISNCSFDNKSGIWSGKEKIEITKKEYEIIKLSEDDEIIKNELNKNIKIYLKQKTINNQEWLLSDINLSNSIPHLTFQGKIKTISKYKFNKIKKYKFTEPDLIVSKKYIIFHDKKGSILKFDKNTKLLWSKNIYNKNEKKNILEISFAVSNKTIFVSDNLGKYYALNLDTGKLIWEKKINSPFKSQIKIKSNQLFITDVNNVLWSFSTLNGKVLWNVGTQTSLISSRKKLSIVISDNSVIFSNSVGDITKVDRQNGDYIWQIPTQNTLSKISTNFLKVSDLVLQGNEIFFSNNKNQFFSINHDLGVIKWKQNVNSHLRPIIIDNLIFTVSNEGFFIVLDKESGKIIRSTYLLDKFKKKIRDQISFEGFIIASNKVFITTNIGFIIVCPILNGKTEQYVRIGKLKLSEPFISNNNLYIIKNNSIVVLN
tara:strand:- start:102 stop:1430 length:1329 start_codon:yes stop_codon:yes gene_type:complete